MKQNPVLENCLIFETSNSLEAQQPVPETNNSSHLENSQLIARARAVGVIYEFAEPGLVETQNDRRKRHRQNQRRITTEEKRLRKVVGDLPPPPPAGSSRVLLIPEYLVCSQGTICSGTEGLCILLRRLAYPCRYSDLVQRCQCQSYL